MTTEGYRFAADAALGRLAKHLRLLGFDVVCQEGVDAGAFFDRAGRHRIALTRIRHLCGRLPQHRWLFVGINNPDRQVAVVLAAFGLNMGDLHPFSRCALCNLPVVPIEAMEVQGRVPPYVIQTQTQFSSCSRCGRIFWPGSHTQRYRNRIRKWLQGEFPVS